MVHSDADGCVVFLTDVQEGDETVAYLLDFFCILFIRILQLLEGTGSIYVVAGLMRTFSAYKAATSATSG